MVRGYIEEKIGGEYLIPLLGVWEDTDDIDFEKLPDRFVLKCNHGSGMNIIVRDKSKLDIRFAREKLRAWMRTDHGMIFFEKLYCDIPRRIIAEKFIEVDGDTPDYKFHCFDGKPMHCQFMTGRFSKLHQSFLDLKWELTPYHLMDYPRHEDQTNLPCPKNLEKMIDLAKKLSADFKFVRVDFYEIDGRIYFGELTFIPAAGFAFYDPPEWNLRLGDLIKLPPK